MFTGLVEDTGSVVSITPTSSGSRLVVSTALDLASTHLGDSIAVDGVCLTVVAMTADRVSFDVGPETQAVSTFRAVLKVGRRVHLERAVRVGDRLGGHIVAGHVDGVGTVRRRQPQGDALFIGISAPATIVDLCIPKGSITVDGVSLTLN
ncbi:MAG TPA: riboflavin synthase, partial [Myxococcota bacterium]